MSPWNPSVSVCFRRSIIICRALLKIKRRCTQRAKKRVYVCVYTRAWLGALPLDNFEERSQITLTAFFLIDKNDLRGPLSPRSLSTLGAAAQPPSPPRRVTTWQGGILMFEKLTIFSPSPPHFSALPAGALSTLFSSRERARARVGVRTPIWERRGESTRKVWRIETCSLGAFCFGFSLWAGLR